MIRKITLCSLVAILFSCQKDNLTEPVAENEQLIFTSGRNDYSIMVDGLLRHFIVHVPQSYSEGSGVPLMFMLHGSSGTGEKFWRITSWAEKAEKENFIAVFPTAMEYPIAEKNGKFSTKWSSAGLVQEVVPGTEIIDDIPFLRAIISNLENSFNLDKSRYYISGFSNGGGFVKSRVLIEMTDVFAAVSSAGGLGLAIPFTTTQPVYLPLYNMVGSLDTKLLDKMGGLEELPFGGEELMSNSIINQSLNNVLDILHLSPEFTTAPNVPSYNILMFQDSEVNQNTEYILQIINDMGHNYPNGKNNPHEIDAVDFLWPWFMKFKK